MCCHILFIHSSVVGHLGCCFHLLAILNNADLNMSMQISLGGPALNLLGTYSEGRVAESYGNSLKKIVYGEEIFTYS